jgi:hypothetical protein
MKFPSQDALIFILAALALWLLLFRPKTSECCGMPMTAALMA